VVNEFGAVGIDGAAIEAAAADSGGGRTVVRQIAGGCMCCVTLGLLSACIAQIIRQTKPDRCGVSYGITRLTSQMCARVRVNV
jgi:G3E family GTPase